MEKIFFERFSELSKEIGESPNSVAKKLGISSGSVTAWKKGADPRNATVIKLADFFGVSVDYLLGNVNEPYFYLDTNKIKSEINKIDKKEPILTEKDRHDIAYDIDKIMQDLDSSGDLMFDGDPMSDEARESIRSALHVGLELAKSKNKEKYTPKKYRK